MVQEAEAEAGREEGEAVSEEGVVVAEGDSDGVRCDTWFTGGFLDAKSPPCRCHPQQVELVGEGGKRPTFYH